MRIEKKKKNDVSVVKVSGDIDISSSQEVRQYFESLLEENGNKVIINLGEVEYVDSSGLAAFVDILKKMRASGGTLKLSNVPGKVKGLFEITKLDKIFDMVDDEDDALDSF